MPFVAANRLKELALKSDYRFKVYGIISVQLDNGEMIFVDKQKKGNENNIIDIMNPSKETIDTGGGAYVSGSVNTGGGDFVGRDKKVIGGDNSLVVGRDLNIAVNIKPGTISEPVYLVPPKPGLVIGRSEQLRELKIRLGIGQAGVHSVPMQVLTAMRGWPGVGKTTLASLLAHDPETRQSFPDGILWTSLGPDASGSLLSKLAEWGRVLGSDALLQARDPQEAQYLLAALLHERRMLLLIDDAWQVEQARPFMAGSASCATLITTRLADVAASLVSTPDQVYWLPVLADNDALELLRALAPGVVQQFPVESLELVKVLEGLPLAIQVAGRLLQAESARGFGVRELMENIHQGAVLLQSKAPADRADLVKETTPTVAALLFTSLEKLDEYTRECYAYLGVFAPKPATFDRWSPRCWTAASWNSSPTSNVTRCTPCW
jgi:hypothetical protein